MHTLNIPGDESDVVDLLIGQQIVSVQIEGDQGTLELDNGTLIKVIPNAGADCCSSGYYRLTKLANVANVITSVHLEEIDIRTRSIYSIFVVADAHEMEILTVEGDDGNGCYGSGYRLTISLPNKEDQ